MPSSSCCILGLDYLISVWAGQGGVLFTGLALVVRSRSVWMSRIIDAALNLGISEHLVYQIGFLR
jgi:hypothetical protein